MTDGTLSQSSNYISPEITEMSGSLSTGVSRSSSNLFFFVETSERTNSKFEISDLKSLKNPVLIKKSALKKSSINYTKTNTASIFCRVLTNWIERMD